MALSFQALAVNGPTAQNLPPFQWTEFPHILHNGQPELWDFEFELQDPDWANFSDFRYGR